MMMLVAPVLQRCGVAHKIPLNLSDVIAINSGDLGKVQLGKVVTVYPRDDKQMREVVAQVDRVWAESCGPEVQTDLHIRPRSAVSLRFGAFHSGAGAVVDSAGTYHFALTLPNGMEVPDIRGERGEQVAGSPAPPLPCCRPTSSPVKVGTPVVCKRGRYLPLQLLKDSAKAQIFLGVCMQTLQTIVLKVATPGVGGDAQGLDVQDRLLQEFAVLSGLESHTEQVPKAVDWRGGNWPVLVMSDFRGDVVATLDRARRLEALPGLAATLQSVHNAGYVHADMKLDNVVWSEQGLGLLDFELAKPVGERAGAGGTRGYKAPEATADASAAFAQDIYALGSCVAEAVLGIPLSLLPEGVGRVRHLLALENAHTASRLVGLLCHPQPEARPDAATASVILKDAVASLAPPLLPAPPLSKRERNWCWRASVDAPRHVRHYSLGDGRGVCWKNSHAMSAFHCEGLNVGAAGIILGLLTVDRALQRDDFTDDVEAGCRWLASRPPIGNAAGLFTGNAGVALVLAVAAMRLGDEHLLSAAKQRLAAAAGDTRQSDLFSGAAGVAWTACALAGILGEDWPYEHARRAVCVLNERLRCDNDIPDWVPDGAAGPMYLGCAHGSAGIALALAAWGRLSGDERSIELSLNTFKAIGTKGRTRSDGALKVTLEGEDAHAVNTWCHGVAGFLWCMLQGHGDHPRLRKELDWAVISLQRAATVGTATYCHGLSGQLELWRMLTNIPRHRDLATARAAQTVRALRALHRKVDGEIVWWSDIPDVVTPDLWVGFLGPATALAMYASKQHAALLSVQWLRTCACR